MQWRTKQWQLIAFMYSNEQCAHCDSSKPSVELVLRRAILSITCTNFLFSKSCIHVDTLNEPTWTFCSFLVSSKSYTSRDDQNIYELKK